LAFRGVVQIILRLIRKVGDVVFPRAVAEEGHVLGLPVEHDGHENGKNEKSFHNAFTFLICKIKNYIE
jgi:hypothetical protein